MTRIYPDYPGSEEVHLWCIGILGRAQQRETEARIFDDGAYAFGLGPRAAACASARIRYRDERASRAIHHCAIMSNNLHLAMETLKFKQLSRYIGKVSELYGRYWQEV